MEVSYHNHAIGPTTGHRSNNRKPQQATDHVAGVDERIRVGGEGGGRLAHLGSAAVLIAGRRGGRGGRRGQAAFLLLLISGGGGSGDGVVVTAVGRHGQRERDRKGNIVIDKGRGGRCDLIGTVVAVDHRLGRRRDELESVGQRWEGLGGNLVRGRCFRHG